MTIHASLSSVKIHFIKVSIGSYVKLDINLRHSIFEFPMDTKKHSLYRELSQEHSMLIIVKFHKNQDNLTKKNLS